MYLNLFHNGKKYIYETGNKLNIGHLKEISENILKSNKNIMQIVYDNPSTYHKYINPDDNTFLRDLIPKGQKRAKFSIRLQKGNSTTNLKLFQQNQKSIEFNKSLDNMSKKFFGNFSYMYSAQKKFDTMITYKYNELLLEIRELIRRIKEIYEEIYKIYEKCNSSDMSKNNKNDVTNKMKLITEYEFQIIKFIEKEKNFYSKLNYEAKQCLFEQKGKTNISNRAMKELYKNMFTDNNQNFKFNLDEKNYISNIIESTVKNGENNNNKEHNNINGKNNLLLEDELFQDKILKMKSKKNFRSFSSFNLNNNYNTDSNNNTNNNFSYSNFNHQKNNSNVHFNINEFKENSNQFIPKINTNNINNNNNMNLNKSNKSINSNLDSAINKVNRSNSKLLISTEVGEDGVQRGRISLFFQDKNQKKNSAMNDDINKTNFKKNNEEETGKEENKNSRFDLIKNRLSFRNSKFGLPLFKSKEEIKKNLKAFSFEEKGNNNLLNIDSNKNMRKNTSTNMTKELMENKENKENKDIKNNQESKINIRNSKNPSPGTDNEDKSDSTDYLKSKNKQLDSNNTIKNNNDLNKEKEKENDKINSEKNTKSSESNVNKEGNGKENKDNTDNNDNNNEQKQKENNQTDNDNKTPILKLDSNSNEESEENKSKKKKKEKKVRKKRKTSSEDDDNSSENNTEKKKKKTTRKKTNIKNNLINEDSRESEKSKKSGTEDLFDLHLLRNLSLDKDNPYKKNNHPLYGNGMKKMKENELIKPEIPESDDSEEDKKKLALFKKKKKNHIKNKYDFLI